MERLLLKNFIGMMLPIRKLLLVFLFLGFTKVFGQLSPAEELAKYQDLYPGETGVITTTEKVLTIELVEDSLVIQAEESKEILVLDKPSRWVKDKKYSSTFSEITELEAYTLIPSKRKYKSNEVSDFKKSFDKDTYVFYDDTEVITFNYPNVAIGTKIGVRTVKRFKDPHIIGQFFFLSYQTTIHASYIIRVGPNIAIKHGLLNDSTLTVSYDSSILKNDWVEYRYEAKNLPKLTYEDNGPSFNSLSPSVFTTVASYTDSSGDRKNVLSSLEDLHGWYRTFLNGIKNNSSVKDISNSIVNEGDSDLEKARKIFYWVQENIKYIAFEQGIRGFIPHPADYVIEKRYGDCKDMTSLLVGLLNSQGLDARFTWIGTRKLPYKYSELHTPSVDNHMIASIEIEGNTFFLDATGNYTPMGLPTSMIQGKEALISKDDSFEIKEVPVVDMNHNMMRDSVLIKLENGTINGSGNVHLSGLMKVDNTYGLIQKSSIDEERNVKRLVQKGSNKFYLESYAISNVSVLDKPLEIDYTFYLEDYYRTLGDEIYINLFLDTSLAENQITERVNPLDNDYKFISSSVVKLEIPDGYIATHVPPNSKFNSDILGFEITYTKTNDSVVARSKIHMNALRIMPHQFEEWNEVISNYAKSVRQSLVLKKIQ